jgi:hypothetical protein
MKRPFAAIGVVLSVAVLGAQQDVIDRYCVSCHNDRLKTSGVTLEKKDPARAATDPELWEKVVRKLQARAMPPQGARRPDEATYHAMQGGIERVLDAEAAAHPNPGAPILHRLNRSEYANAVHDLLALDVDVTSLLPPDDAAFGFDNISDVLGVSPSLQEKYLSAAAKKVAGLSVKLASRTPPAIWSVEFSKILVRCSTASMGASQARPNAPAAERRAIT